MKWQKIVIEELESHPRKINSLCNLKDKIKTLELKKVSLKGQQYDKTPVTGTGGNHYEDSMLDAITEIDKLKNSYIMNKKDVERVGKALRILNGQEYRIIESFYMKGQRPNITKLEEDLKYEKSQIYRMRDKALRKLTYELYGREEA